VSANGAEAKTVSGSRKWMFGVLAALAAGAGSLAIKDCRDLSREGAAAITERRLGQSDLAGRVRALTAVVERLREELRDAPSAIAEQVGGPIRELDQRLTALEARMAEFTAQGRRFTAKNGRDLETDSREDRLAIRQELLAEVEKLRTRVAALERR
jgi:hypothetical protein